MMNIKKHINIFILFITAIVINSCVDPFDISSISYDRILVVEGRLTNELKQHEINLSFTIPLDSIILQPEKNASVFVIDDTNQIFDFIEITDGKYISNSSFSPNSERTYTLKIELADGSKYSSTPQQLTGTSEIESITASIDENNLDIEKLNINVNAFSTDDNVNYYYYEYEETNESSAPFYSFFEVDLSALPSYSLITKDPLSQFCYNTVFSSGLRLQAETLSLSENKISNFTIRSIATDDFILSKRYSILVKQFTQSFNAYTYHETLNRFSSFESVFSENQVGFLKGNIFNENNYDQKVIGFFEVNSVVSKRIFINREDFFDTPFSYPIECNIDDIIFAGASLETGGNIISGLYENGYRIYTIENITDNGIYTFAFVPKDCADCSVFGEDKKPDWWIN